MGLFTWDGESEDVAHDATAAAPLPTSLVRDVPAPPTTSSVSTASTPAAPSAEADRPPLTRRELRERERAAELQAIAAATANPVVSAAWPVITTHQPEDSEAPTFSMLTPETVSPETVSPEPVVAESVVIESISTSSVEQIFAPVTSSPAADSPDEPSAGPAKSRKIRSFRRTRKPAVVQSSSARPSAHHVGRRTPLKRRILTKLMSFGAMTGAALMLVATSLPANAFLPAEATPLSAASAATTAPAAAADVAVEAPVAAEAQSLKMAPTVEAPVLSRDGYTAVSLREQMFLKYGNRSYSYIPNPAGEIRWPFPIAVPISDGFGYRVSPCGGCSSDHHGVDFTPGAGAAIGVIADGVVVGVNSEDWSYGQHVLVDHLINGQRVQSWYAHMASGSIRVQVGDQLKVGDIVGLVGSTGASTGAHLHLEIHVNDVPVDPFAWLQANAG